MTRRANRDPASQHKAASAKAASAKAAGAKAASAEAPRWLLLIHQIPPKPNYLRVKIWRRLQRVGAVAIKSSVYVLPRSDQAYEDFEWVLREICKQGGDALICEARFAHGMTDEQVEALFRTARDADYEQINADARRLAEERAEAAERGDDRPRLEADVTRLRARFAEVVAIDLFDASQRETADGLLSGLERRLRSGEPRQRKRERGREKLRGRTWVTRHGIHVDRMASAWLIRRFIDPDARFKFVQATGHRHKRGELRFDMFEGELTHEEDRCTFEVLLQRFALHEPALRTLSEIIHDLDLKDAKFGRPETPGIEQVLAGIAAAHKDDIERLRRSSAVLDDLYAHLKRKPR